jgi:hypothetical protein
MFPLVTSLGKPCRLRFISYLHSNHEPTGAMEEEWYKMYTGSVRLYTNSLKVSPLSNNLVCLLRYSNIYVNICKLKALFYSCTAYRYYKRCINKVSVI